MAHAFMTKMIPKWLSCNHLWLPLEANKDCKISPFLRRNPIHLWCFWMVALTAAKKNLSFFSGRQYYLWSESLCCDLEHRYVPHHHHHHHNYHHNGSFGAAAAAGGGGEPDRAGREEQDWGGRGGLLPGVLELAHNCLQCSRQKKVGRTLGFSCTGACLC